MKVPALCSASRSLPIAHLGLCQVGVGTDANTLTEWVQLIPAGPEIDAVDGRHFRNPSPDKVLEAFKAYGLDIPVDFEHATEILAPQGKQAPAAGWIDKLEVRDGSIWGHVAWTPSGKAALTGREYRYISPAFLHDPQGNVVELVSAGLTNKPALTQLAAVARVMSTAEINDLPDSDFLYIEPGGKKDATGKTEPRSLRHFPVPDIEHVRNALARIPQADLPADVKAKCEEKAKRMLEELNKKAEPAKARKEITKMNPELLKLLGLAEDATPEAVLAACQKLTEDAKSKSSELATARAELEKAIATPDLKSFVPRADYEVAVARANEAEKKIAEDKAAAHKKEVDAEVEAAVKAGKITPATADFYRATCSAEGGLDKFREFVKAAPVVAPDSNLDKKVEDKKSEELTDEEMAIATRCGLTAEQFRAHKKSISK